MKKVIDGKMYNTETATLIAEASSGLNYGDFQHWEEELYITKKGSYFLYGYGGPASRYAAYTGNMSTGSSEIIALTREETYEWLEENDCVQAIEQHFADYIEEA